MQSRFLHLGLGLVLILTLWSVLSLTLSGDIIPTPWSVMATLTSAFTYYSKITAITALTSLSGLIIAIVVSAPLIWLMVVFPTLEATSYPSLVLLKATPAVVFGPLLVQFFGIGFWPKALITALICFFPILVSGIDGAKSVPDKLKLLSTGYGARRAVFFKHIQVGYALRGLTTGLKIAAPLAAVGAIVAEFVLVGTWAGIGNVLLNAMGTYSSAGLFSVMLCSTLIGGLLFLAASGAQWLVERRLHLAK